MRSILQKPGAALRFRCQCDFDVRQRNPNCSCLVSCRPRTEIALGTFAVLQTIPAMLMLPFTGVIIDREDRRRLVMMLDAGRAVVAVSILAFMGKAKIWELYLMNTLVAAGFWTSGPRSRP